MKILSMHDLSTTRNVFQIELTDLEIVQLPSWLRPPQDTDLVNLLRYLTEVARYLTDLENEEITMLMLDQEEETEFTPNGDPDVEDPLEDPLEEDLIEEDDEATDLEDEDLFEEDTTIKDDEDEE